MTGLSRCGRQYASFSGAVLAAELRTSKGAKPLVVTSCQLGEHWHLVRPLAAVNGAQHRPDPFPPVIAALLDARDEVCQRCGRGGRLERHHRRAKASGGSKARSHTQCACNGVRLCRSCHEFVHSEVKRGRALGMVVLQSVSLPGSVAVLRRTDTLNKVNPFSVPSPWRPTCDGRWVSDGE